MSSSLRRRRMARSHRRMNKPTKLNLVALMDIFTILVLFLIVNTGDVEVLDADKNVALPESVSELRPEATLVIKISPNDIRLQDKLIGRVDVFADDNATGTQTQASSNKAATTADTLALLKQALDVAALQDEHWQPEEHPNGRPIIIMGDKSTPFELLKQIMATCASTDFRDISLAVNSVPIAAEASEPDPNIPSAPISAMRNGSSAAPGADT